MAASIQGIYVALFGRPADPAGLAFFNEATQNGADLTAIGDLASTAEYQDRFTGMSYVQVVNSIYQSLFGRDPEPEGLSFYVQLLLSGELNINWIAVHIMNGAQGDDLTKLNNKIAAANLFTAGLDTDAEIEAYVGNDAAQIGRDFLAEITSDPDTFPTQAEVDAAILLLFAPDEGQQPIGGGGFATTPAFIVTVNDDEVSFSGRATGIISYEIVDGAAVFVRGGVTARREVENITDYKIVLADDQVLSIVGGQLQNQAVTGVGSVLLSGDITDVDVVKIDPTVPYSVPEGSNLTLTGQQANGSNLPGQGTVAIKDLQADTDLSGIEPGGTAFINESFTFTGTLASHINVIVADGKTLTIDAERAEGINISGEGSTVATGSDGSQTLIVLTSGGNTINGGPDGDIIISGDGADVITPGDVVEFTPADPGAQQALSVSISDGNGKFYIGYNFYFEYYWGASSSSTSFQYFDNNETQEEVAQAITIRLNNSIFVADYRIDDNDNILIDITSKNIGQFPIFTLLSNKRDIVELSRTNGSDPIDAVIEITAAVDVMTGGLGADVFHINASGEINDDNGFFFNIDTITDFESGIDIIEFAVAGGDSVQVSEVSLIDGSEADGIADKTTLEEAVALVLQGLNEGEHAAFGYNGVNYIVFSGDGDDTFDAGFDHIVILGTESIFSEVAVA